MRIVRKARRKSRWRRRATPITLRATLAIVSRYLVAGSGASSRWHYPSSWHLSPFSAPRVCWSRTAAKLQTRSICRSRRSCATSGDHRRCERIIRYTWSKWNRYQEFEFLVKTGNIQYTYYISVVSPIYAIRAMFGRLIQRANSWVILKWAAYFYETHVQVLLDYCS